MKLTKKISIFFLLASALVVGGTIYVASADWAGGTSVANTHLVDKSNEMLILDLGNNDGSSTIYDTSINRRHATSSGNPVYGTNGLDFDGTGDYVSLNSTDIFNSNEITIAIKFTPTKDWNENFGTYLFDSTLGSRNFCFKGGSGLSFNLGINLGGTDIEQIAPAAYSAYWRKNQENVLVIRGDATNDDTYAWLNGNLILDNDQTAWSPNNPSTMYIGSAFTGAYWYGEIHDVKIWHRLLSDDEVQMISSNREQKIFSANSRGNLVGWWTLDANDYYNDTTVYDKSGYGTHGTDNNMDSSNIISGKIREGFDFNGTNEFINTSDPDILDFGTSDFTVSAWVKTGQAGNYESIISKGNIIAGNSGWTLGQHAAVPDALFFRIRESGVGFADGLGGSIGDDEWHHIAARRDNKGGSEFVDVYVDGAFVDDGTYAGDLDLDNATIFIIGQGYVPFNGSIDDVRIYNKLLSKDEISNLYNSSRRQYIK